MIDASEPRTAVSFCSDARLDESPSLRRKAATDVAGCGVAELAADLAHAHDTLERQALMRRAIQQAGFDWLCYWRIVRVGEIVSRATWFDTYSPRGWPERYSREQFFDIDPRLTPACRFEWPFAWDSDALVSPSSTSRRDDKARRLGKAMGQIGLKSGLCFGIPTRNPLEHCVIILSSSQQGCGWIADAKIGEVYAIGVGLNEFIEERARDLLPTVDAPELNDVQHAILRHVTEGLSDREIAEHLSTSTHNIGYHLRQLKRIFNAQSRVQLAYIAGCILED
jgi:DNA-binding CsgD family transcriptional regulator